MNTELLSKTIALDNECDRFLSAFNVDSLPRVVERGLKPITKTIADIIVQAQIPLGFVDIKQVPIGHGKVIEGVVHIGVDCEGCLVCLVVSPDASRIAGPPRRTSYEELVSLGVTGLDLAHGAKAFAQSLLKAQMSSPQGNA